MRNEKTSKRVASIAGQIMAFNKKYSTWIEFDDVCGHDKDDDDKIIRVSWKDIRALAASALTQTADKKPAKKAKRRAQGRR